MSTLFRRYHICIYRDIIVTYFNNFRLLCNVKKEYKQRSIISKKEETKYFLEIETFPNFTIRKTKSNHLPTDLIFFRHNDSIAHLATTTAHPLFSFGRQSRRLLLSPRSLSPPQAHVHFNSLVIFQVETEHQLFGDDFSVSWFSERQVYWGLLMAFAFGYCGTSARG